MTGLSNGTGHHQQNLCNRMLIFSQGKLLNIIFLVVVDDAVVVDAVVVREIKKSKHLFVSKF